MATLSNAVAAPTPQCLNDFALMPTSRFKLTSMLDQTMAFPSTGVNGIVLFGLYGTGKTTLANLLPGLLESSKAHADPANLDPDNLIDDQSPSSQYHACMQGQNGLTLIQGIQSSTGFVAWNTSGLHYVILDEVDLLTEAAMTSFKSVMNRKNVVFIMTTNHLDKIDPGIQNRSVLVDMNQPPLANWRPLLRRIYTQANLTPPSDATLDQVVQAGRGSARTIFNDVVMSANQARRQGQQQVAKVSNIRS